MRISADDIQVPTELEPGWKLRGPIVKPYVCEGCNTGIDDGSDPDHCHTVLDCLKVLKEQISDLQHQLKNTIQDELNDLRQDVNDLKP